MKLLSLDSPGIIELAAGWLAQKENSQWLDFGHGRLPVTPALLKIMAQRDTHVIRIYTENEDDRPIGIVALNSVDRDFRSATIWGAAGDKAYAMRGYGNLAGSMMIAFAFRDLGLHSINTWIVDNNPSMRMAQRLGFRFAGRLRQCHFIDGRPYDRLLYDLLPEDFTPFDESRLLPARTPASSAVAAGLGAPMPAPGYGL